MKIKTLVTTIAFSCFAFSMVYAAENLKKTVAVFGFENDSGYGSWVQMGQDFSDQLTDSLLQSGNFIVLSRTDLDVVMAEQDLAASDRFAKSATAQIGKLIPAQILVKGKITDFEEQTSGGGQGFSIKGISLGTQKSTASIGVIVQLIDSTTGQVLASKRVDGEARGGGMSLGYSGAWSLSSSCFQKTPVGQAAQMAIDRAVVFISEQLADVPWSGKVVTVKDGVVFINAGTNAGVISGSTFAVYREEEALIDPDTGMNLGSDRKKIGIITVSDVQEKFSRASFDGDVSKINRGDLILK